MRYKYSVWINQHLRREFNRKQAALTYAYSWKELFPHLEVTVKFNGKELCL